MKVFDLHIIGLLGMAELDAIVKFQKYFHSFTQTLLNLYVDEVIDFYALKAIGWLVI